MGIWRHLCFAVGLMVISRIGFADSVTLRDGRTIEGVVLKNGDQEVKIRTEVGVMGFDRSRVDSVDISQAPMAANIRLVDWQHSLASLVNFKLGAAVEQIPATVIDKGILKAVPYMSFHSGIYEMNVYGDPAKPACIEIGVYQGSLASDSAKASCRRFVRAVVGEADKATVDGLKSQVDLVVRDGFTFEVTPPTGDDSYGGWWISVYSTTELDAARASNEEMARITQSKSHGVSTRPVETVTPTAAVTPAVPVDQDSIVPAWTADEISRSRASSDSSGGGGSVYVSGYTRKNGTYVHSYTRSAPGSGSGRRR